MAVPTSKVDIANRALKKLGQPLITALPPSENNKAAVAINNMFEPIRNNLLRMHPWNFAIKRATLAKLSSTPAWGWSYEYGLPGDFLCLIDVKDNIKHAIESNKILTDEDGTIGIRYVYKVEDTSQFDPTFSEAFATKLALELVEDITNSNTKKQILMQQFEMHMADARSRDGRERGKQEYPQDDWVTVRY